MLLNCSLTTVLEACLDFIYWHFNWMDLLTKHTSDIWKGNAYLHAVSAGTYQGSNQFWTPKSKSLNTVLFYDPNWFTLMSQGHISAAHRRYNAVMCCINRFRTVTYTTFKKRKILNIYQMHLPYWRKVFIALVEGRPKKRWWWWGSPALPPRGR